MDDLEKLAQWHDGMAVWPVQERHTAAAATIRAAMGEIEQLREVSRSIVATLTSNGTNSDGMMTIDHDALRAIGKQAATLKAPAHD